MENGIEKSEKLYIRSEKLFNLVHKGTDSIKVLEVMRAPLTPYIFITVKKGYEGQPNRDMQKMGIKLAKWEILNLKNALEKALNNM